MYKPFRFLLSFAFLGLLLIANSNFVLAQVPPPPPPPPPPPRLMADVDAVTKTPGATVRGRVVYEDSGLPFRYALIGLAKADKRVNYYSTVFAKTDENGDFILKDIPTGDYYPYLKNDGILNPDAFERLNRFDRDSMRAEEIFQKISVNGQGEFQIFVRAKRGSSFSGVVRYFDGEAAVGVNVEALRKLDDKFLAYPVGKAKTDDRGYYRFAGLPEGNYTVRVIEPISHKAESSSYYRGNDSSSRELLKTYYPQAETAAEANGFDLINGQEQTAIDVTLPERLLFDISGKIVLKQTGEPLKGFNVTFQPIIEKADEGLTFGNRVGVGSGFGSRGNSSDSDFPSDWALRSLPKGKYRVIATQVKSYRKEDRNKTQYPDIVKEIEVIDGDIENIIFEIPTAASIRGIVIAEGNKPLPNYGRAFARNTKTDSTEFEEFDYAENKSKKPINQKAFVIHKLAAGKFKIGFNSREVYIRSVFIGGRELRDGILELEDGDEIENVRIVVASDMGTVKGKVKNYKAENAASILLVKNGITFVAPNSDTFFGRVNNNGTFEIKVKPGEYRAIVLTQSNSPKSREDFIEFMKNALENAPIAKVKKNETTNLDLDLSN